MGFANKAGTSRTLSMIVWTGKAYNTKEGEYWYDEETVYDKLKKYINDPNVEFVIGKHDRCVDLSGKPVATHLHIKMRYTDSRTFKQPSLINKFPYCDFQSINGEEDITGDNDEPSGWEASLAYLLHRGWDSKTQYEYKDLFTNISEEHYMSYVDAYVAKNDKRSELFKARQERKEEVANMRYQIVLNDFERKKHDLELEQLYFEYRDKIINGELGPRRYRRMVKESEDKSMLRQMDSKYQNKIKASFEFYNQWKSENCMYRDLTVWVIEGSGGAGKTLLAQQICVANDLLYSISSAQRDPFSTVKPDDDVFICNDFRDSTLSYREFLHTMEPHLVTEAGSRFYNKSFYGKLVIITTPKSIDDWYNGVEAKADTALYGKDTMNQFHRRIQRIIKVEGENEEYYSVYDHHPDGTNTFVKRYHNPVALLTPEQKKQHEYLINDNFLADAIRSVADALDVRDAYEDKIATCAIPDGDIEKYIVRAGNGHAVNDIDCMFILDNAVKQLTEKGVVHADAIKYLSHKLSVYFGNKEDN